MVSVQRSLRLHAPGVECSPNAAQNGVPCVLVFIVMDTMSTAATLERLRQCACLLAPCTPDGMLEPVCGGSSSPADTNVGEGRGQAGGTGQQVPNTEPNPADDVVQHLPAPSAAVRPSASSLAKYGAAASWGYVLRHGPAKRDITPGAALLASPVRVVLQAISPAMLQDMSQCSIRSVAFSVFTKLAAAAAASSGQLGRDKKIPVPGARTSDGNAVQTPAKPTTVLACSPAFKLADDPLPELGTGNVTADLEEADTPHEHRNGGSGGGRSAQMSGRGQQDQVARGQRHDRQLQDDWGAAHSRIVRRAGWGWENHSDGTVPWWQSSGHAGQRPSDWQEDKAEQPPSSEQLARGTSKNGNCDEASDRDMAAHSFHPSNARRGCGLHSVHHALIGATSCTHLSTLAMLHLHLSRNQLAATKVHSSTETDLWIRSAEQRNRPW